VIDIASWQGSLTNAEQEQVNAYLGSPSEIFRIFFVVPAVRGFESTVYRLGSEALDDLFGARSAQLDAERVLTTIAYRRELEAEISDFSEKVLGVRLRVKLIPDKQVSAEAYNGSSLNLVNEGFGANQLMVLLAQLVIAPPDSLVGVEEAEIHLHPKAQSDLARIFVELVRSHGKQIILTTHSEHMVMGLLTSVARGDLSPEHLRVYYFQKQNGVASAERLGVDEAGRLQGGMKGFFEASVGQLSSYLTALSER
jgi:hypothetical protein